MTADDDCGGSDGGSGRKKKEDKRGIVRVHIETNNVLGQMQNYERNIEFFYFYA